MTVYISDKYTIPEHVSYSALTTYIDCGYLYYLGRLLEIPEQPAVWSVGGSAFHKATEEWDKQYVE
jgi:ATP-dependent helicase/DNAse subunit B